jgi:nucleotide-binding universal stress UspA family protein
MLIGERPGRTAISRKGATMSTSYQRLLVPIDGSATATRGLDEAIRLCRATGGSIRVLHVLDDLVFISGFESGASYAKDVFPRLRKRAEQLLEDGRKRVEAAGVAADKLLVECYARRTSEVVCEQAIAWRADLIVVGTHGRRGVRRMMLGSDAEQIVREAPVPVLVVRAAESAPDAAIAAAKAEAATAG